MDIRKLKEDEKPPMDLLLSADPAESLVEEYVQRGECFVAEIDHKIIGVYVLLPTRPGTVELVNIAVIETLQNQGIGKQLVTHAIQTAKSWGFKTIEVGTGNSSIGQLAFIKSVVLE